MKSIAVVAALLAVCASTGLALGDTEAGSDEGSNYLLFETDRETTDRHLIAADTHKRRMKRSFYNLAKRQSAFSQDLDNAQLLYFANVSLGSNQQPIRLQIDSGSSDVWVEYASSRFCRKGGCAQGGAFDPNSSGSFNVVGQNQFQISYVDGTSAQGDYFTDDFQVGGKTVKQLQMGIARQTNIPIGIMGIGFDINEAIVASGGQPYPSLIDQMKSQGLIKAKAYSVWLNDLDNNKGNILFGGVDTEKYQGKLVGLDLQTNAGEKSPSEFAVALTGLTVTDGNGNSKNIDTKKELPVAAVLDSGSSFTVLPNNIADNCAKVVQGEFSSDLQSYIVDCSYQFDNTATYDFKFGSNDGPVIRVPLKELVHPAVDQNQNKITDDSGNPICQLGIIRSGSLSQASYLFGDTFLRSAYVVFNIDENRAYIAQTVFNSTKTNIKEIASATEGGVPDVAGVANGVTVTPSATSKPIHGGNPRHKGAASHTISFAFSILASTVLGATLLLI